MIAPAWSGRTGASSTRRPRRVLGQVRLDLLGVERAARGGEVVDRALGLQPEREPEVAELQVEVDDDGALCPASASATPRFAAVSVLPVPPFGPEDADQRSVGGRRRRPRRAGARSPSAWRRTSPAPGVRMPSRRTMSSAPELRTPRARSRWGCRRTTTTTAGRAVPGRLARRNPSATPSGRCTRPGARRSSSPERRTPARRAARRRPRPRCRDRLRRPRAPSESSRRRRRRGSDGSDAHRVPSPRGDGDGAAILGVACIRRSPRSACCRARRTLRLRWAACVVCTDRRTEREPELRVVGCVGELHRLLVRELQDHRATAGPTPWEARRTRGCHASGSERSRGRAAGDRVGGRIDLLPLKPIRRRRGRRDGRRRAARGCRRAGSGLHASLTQPAADAVPAAEKSAAVICWPGRMSRTATLPTSAGASATDPSRRPGPRPGRLEELLGHHHVARRPLRDQAIGGEDRGRVEPLVDARLVLVR